MSAGFLFAGCNQTQPAPQAQTTVTTDGSYTLEQITEHSTAEDCWFAIEGSVYDVTQFIADKKHPGGAAILEGCGKDATELFETRPMGSGTEHSAAARELLQTFEIGTLTN